MPVPTRPRPHSVGRANGAQASVVPRRKRAEGARQYSEGEWLFPIVPKP